MCGSSGCSANLKAEFLCRGAFTPLHFSPCWSEHPLHPKSVPKPGYPICLWDVLRTGPEGRDLHGASPWDLIRHLLYVKYRGLIGNMCPED